MLKNNLIASQCKGTKGTICYHKNQKTQNETNKHSNKVRNVQRQQDCINQTLNQG